MQGKNGEVSESSDEHEDALEKATLETKSEDRKEVAEYSSSNESDPSIEELNELTEVKVIRKPLEETTQEAPDRFELVR